MPDLSTGHTDTSWAVIQWNWRSGHTVMERNLAKELTEISLRPLVIDASGDPQQLLPDEPIVKVGYTQAGRVSWRDLLADGYSATFEHDDQAAGATGQLLFSRSRSGLHDDPGGVLLVEQGYTWDGMWLGSEAWTFHTATSGLPIAASVTRSPTPELQLAARSVNGSELTFSYDHDGLLTRAGALVITRDDLTSVPPRRHGMVTATTLDQVTTSQGFSDFGELTSLSACTGAGCSTPLLAVTNPERANLGRLVRQTEQVLGELEVTIEHEYDAADRLWRVWRYSTVGGKPALPTEEYTYDERGNRLSAPNLPPAPAPGSPPTYDGQDRLLTYGSASYTWTPDGRLSTKTVDMGGGVFENTIYTYDTFGSLACRNQGASSKGLFPRNRRCQSRSING